MKQRALHDGEARKQRPWRLRRDRHPRSILLTASDEVWRIDSEEDGERRRLTWSPQCTKSGARDGGMNEKNAHDELLQLRQNHPTHVSLKRECRGSDGRAHTRVCSNAGLLDGKHQTARRVCCAPIWQKQSSMRLAQLYVRHVGGQRSSLNDRLACTRRS